MTLKKRNESLNQHHPEPRGRTEDHSGMTNRTEEHGGMTKAG